MIDRHLDAEQLNEVLNHPDVYPWVHGLTEGYLDASVAVADRRNVLLMGEYGGIIFHFHQPGLYEAHTQVLPEGRGPWCQLMTHDALHWMFTRTDCIEVVTRVPKGNLAARALTKGSGLTPRFVNPQGWAINGRIVPAEVFGLTIQEWIKTAPGLAEKGRVIRDRLLYGKPAVDIGFDDEQNCRHLAAAFDMISGGQPEKGVVFFNRWAALTDQPPISMVSRKPMAFDYRDVLIVLRASGDFYATGIDPAAAPSNDRQDISRG